MSDKERADQSAPSQQQAVILRVAKRSRRTSVDRSDWSHDGDERFSANAGRRQPDQKKSIP